MKPFTQNRFLVSLVAILLLANFALLFYFFVIKKPDHPGPKSPRQVSEFVQKELGFDSVQVKKFQELRDQHKEAVKPLIEEMQKLKDSLYSQLQKTTTSDSTINFLANKLGEKQKQWELMIFHHFQDVRAICTDSQLPKFDSLVHKMINRGPWMKKGGPGDKKRQ